MYKLNYDFESFKAEEQLTPMQLECYKARVESYRSRFIWSEALKPLFDVCLVHTSAHVPGKVAYFATLQNMLENKTTRTSPEMFVQRFLAQAPTDLKYAWEHEVMGKILPTISFISNTEPDMWVQVYEEGPHSCMQGADEVRQYANPHNDLALAYFQNSNGKITNRAIVNQKTKTYVRTYGNECSAFAVSLRKLGYSHDDGTLKNQRVYIKHAECGECGESVITGPYLDGDYQFVHAIPNTDSSKQDEGTICDDGERFRSAEEPRCGSCD
jgi:hypothetical protein